MLLHELDGEHDDEGLLLLLLQVDEDALDELDKDNGEKHNPFSLDPRKNRSLKKQDLPVPAPHDN
eukprot:CAMPEP_0173432036 /NCGR_PEP_ID=MMETSP1357-20121228/9976_1 /TAXON_ID=77926 /ORGANISM="Hemiselmis rufescens, Strain PCC563" /LENGTH=64 /DNA_ID=CAMNT_0014396581 /DNA_START=190 /DNA_END=384 /DNA_ORIENTATION=+